MIIAKLEQQIATVRIQYHEIVRGLENDLATSQEKAKIMTDEVSKVAEEQPAIETIAERIGTRVAAADEAALTSKLDIVEKEKEEVSPSTVTQPSPFSISPL